MKKRIMIVLFMVVASIALGAEDLRWEDVAGFYLSNYPNLSINEKAVMLAESMKRHGEKPVIEEKIFEEKILYVHLDGKRIFPPKEMINEIENSKDRWKLLSERVRELDEITKGL